MLCLFHSMSLSFVFDQQRIGYLAASQCFHESTDVIMLTTNQIRKVSGGGSIHHASNSSPWQLFSSLFSLMYNFFLLFFSPRISAAPTSMTQVLLSLASLVLWPLIWLVTWPMTLWHWWAVENLSQGLTMIALCIVFNITISSQWIPPIPLCTSDQIFVVNRVCALFCFASP